MRDVRPEDSEPPSPRENHSRCDGVQFRHILFEAIGSQGFAEQLGGGREGHGEGEALMQRQRGDLLRGLSEAHAEGSSDRSPKSLHRACEQAQRQKEQKPHKPPRAIGIQEAQRGVESGFACSKMIEVKRFGLSGRHHKRSYGNREHRGPGQQEHDDQRKAHGAEETPCAFPDVGFVRVHYDRIPSKSSGGSKRYSLAFSKYRAFSMDCQGVRTSGPRCINEENRNKLCDRCL